MIKEMLFKNASSVDKKRKVFLAYVTNEGNNYISTTQRKYIYLIKRIDHLDKKNQQAQLFVRNERNEHRHIRKLNCLLKGSFLACGPKGLFLIRYAHSLAIESKFAPTKHS